MGKKRSNREKLRILTAIGCKTSGYCISLGRTRKTTWKFFLIQGINFIKRNAGGAFCFFLSVFLCWFRSGQKLKAVTGSGCGITVLKIL